MAGVYFFVASIIASNQLCNYCVNESENESE